MLVHQAFRYELDPNNATRSQLASDCGASRFVYNWGRALVQELLDRRKAVRRACFRELLSDEATEELARHVEVPWNLYALRKEWNRQKSAVAPWWAQNSKFAYESGLEALGAALSNFSRTKGESNEMGFPRRKRHYARRSCRFWSASILDSRHVKLPRIPAIRSKEPMDSLAEALEGHSGRILHATISEEAGRWFVSFCCEVERNDPHAVEPDAIVGVDLGIRHLAVTSTGAVISNPKALSRYQRKLARLAKERSRRCVGSRRHRKTTRDLAKTHRKAANIRRDAIHQATTRLAKSCGTVVLEDLAVRNLTKHGPHKAGINRALLDVAPGEFRRQLTYKLAWRGGRLVVADRFFASSKTCSRCRGTKAKLPLATRLYCCEYCGFVIDRDLNAAMNLAAFGEKIVAAGMSEMENGRRDERSQEDAAVLRCSSKKR